MLYFHSVGNGGTAYRMYYVISADLNLQYDNRYIQHSTYISTNFIDENLTDMNSFDYDLVSSDWLDL